MSAFSAYHRSHKHGEFGDRNYYFTKKTQPQIGDTIFVFSGDKPKKTRYTFEGRFTILHIETGADNNRKLIFREDDHAYVRECVNDMAWFGKEFVSRFVSVGVSAIPDEYIQIFEKLTAYRRPQLLDAIDDLDAEANKKQYSGIQYARNSAVRAGVMKRAAGRCEFCGVFGFVKDDGSSYLETHHIIHLAKQGPDSIHNVIAICPGEHREAHFGRDRKRLEEAFQTRLKLLNRR